jgi:hypothetical protein
MSEIKSAVKGAVLTLAVIWALQQIPQARPFVQRALLGA